LGIGLARDRGELFATVVIFEFLRQFMRWSHAGYLSEHLPSDLRSTAIGCSISMSGLGSTLYGALPIAIMDPSAEGFSSSKPFYLSTMIGITGAIGLFLFDRWRPIRAESTSALAGEEPILDVEAIRR